jgi:hypothetical protein
MAPAARLGLGGLPKNGRPARPWDGAGRVSAVANQMCWQDRFQCCVARTCPSSRVLRLPAHLCSAVSRKAGRMCRFSLRKVRWRVRDFVEKLCEREEEKKKKKKKKIREMKGKVGDGTTDCFRGYTQTAAAKCQRIAAFKLAYDACVDWPWAPITLPGPRASLEANDSLLSLASKSPPRRRQLLRGRTYSTWHLAAAGRDAAGRSFEGGDAGCVV